MNAVQLVGNLGKDVEVFETAGSKKLSFPLATTEKYYNRNNELVEDTDWHNIVYWVKPDSKIHEYLLKGQKVGITGKVKQRTWTKEDGTTGYAYEIQANGVELLGGRQAEEKPKESEEKLPF